MASLKHDAGPPPCAAGPAEAVPRLPPGPSPDSAPTPQYPLYASEQIRGPLSRRQFMHVAVQGTAALSVFGLSSCAPAPKLSAATQLTCLGGTITMGSERVSGLPWKQMVEGPGSSPRLRRRGPAGKLPTWVLLTCATPAGRVFPELERTCPMLGWTALEVGRTVCDKVGGAVHRAWPAHL